MLGKKSISLLETAESDFEKEVFSGPEHARSEVDVALWR